MKPSSATAKTSHAKARNATLVNLLATPGLGSLMAGRLAAGLGQLALAVSGFVLVMVWFWNVIKNYYGQAFGEETVHRSTPLWLLIVGLIFFALSWLWSLVTSLSLMRAAREEKVSELKTFAAAGVKLNEAKIATALATLPSWQREGQSIRRAFEFVDFVAAIKFVDAVAAAAESAQHHPDVDIRSNKVTLALTTHDVGGLTDKDFALARRCEALAK